MVEVIAYIACMILCIVILKFLAEITVLADLVFLQ